MSDLSSSNDGHHITINLDGQNWKSMEHSHMLLSDMIFSGTSGVKKISYSQEKFLAFSLYRYWKNK